MKYIGVLLVLISLVVPVSHAGQSGLIVKKSEYSTEKTIKRLKAVLAQKGIRVFAHVNHFENAASVGLKIRPTELLIFGNPKLGTPLIKSNPAAGLDLPMKVLVWQDEKGQTWLVYNDPAYIAKRHGISDQGEAVAKMSQALGKMTDQALTPN
ncbi:MAG: DUF302 domain-containing protein [Gammaproteobacteria bacterium]|nr:DUF302 domain-containing protein [Gammaproteobacteria bacterium]